MPLKNSSERQECHFRLRSGIYDVKKEIPAFARMTISLLRGWRQQPNRGLYEKHTYPQVVSHNSNGNIYHSVYISLRLRVLCG